MNKAQSLYLLLLCVWWMWEECARRSMCVKGRGQPFIIRSPSTLREFRGWTQVISSASALPVSHLMSPLIQLIFGDFISSKLNQLSYNTDNQSVYISSFVRGGATLRALAAFPENPGSGPSTHVVAHNHPRRQFQRTQCLLWPPWAPGIEMFHRHTCRQTLHTHTQKITLKINYV